MSIRPCIILLESTNNSTVGTLGSEISNDSNLSGRDSPNAVVSDISTITDGSNVFLNCLPCNSDNITRNSSFSTVRSCARTLYTLKYTPQSGDLHISGEAPSETLTNLNTFNDDNSGFEAGFHSDRDDTYYVADSSEFDIRNFFRRPVKVATLAWTVGTPLPFTSQAIFKLFWNQKRVINRLANFMNMKCDMCIKIMVNGTPFHYGCVLANVIPDWRSDSFANTTAGELACVRGSQTPHLLIDPTTSSGGCLRLPYTHRYNAFDPVSPVDDLVAAGTLFMRELVPLQHVSGVVEPITISVLVWAENVVLGAPTARSPTFLVPQSGDEYGDGVVSRPMFALSDFLKHLNRVPIIGRYALASSIGAQNVGLVAKMFGHAKPNVVADIDYMKQRRLPNFSSSNQHDPIYKATFDDKQEVTIDSRVVGLTGDDEMSIVSIARKESYMYQFAWNQTSAVDTDLVNFAVTPQHYRTNGAGANKEHHMSPCAWVSYPFKYWRGTMRFRFVAVASTFHRGRLRIIYDPAFGTTANAPDYNTNQTYYWDLSESKEAIVEVAWHNPKQYLELFNLLTPQLTLTTTPATVPLNIGLRDFANGLISIQVANELTAPDTNLASPVTIMVFVSACDDFEVFDPTNEVAFASYVPQSGLEEHALSNVSHREPHVVFGVKRKGSDPTPLIYHGDSVKSLRVLMKRYSFYRPWVFTPTVAGLNQISLRTAAYPLYRGRIADGVDLGINITPQAYNYCFTTYMNYFTPAFFAKRGGVRHRFVSCSESKVLNATIQRDTSPTYLKSTLVLAGPSANQFTAAFTGALKNTGLSGMTTASDLGSETLDIEIPYHQNSRYLPGRASQANVMSQFMGIFFHAIARVTGTPETSVVLAHYVSAADDYSLMGFVDVPVMYYHPTHLAPG